jgi:hypothetical protein
MTNQPENNANDRLNRIEATLADVADLVLTHNEALTRIESAIAQLTVSTNQAITLASENNLRIREILEYLYQERPNGRGNA